MDNQQDWPEPIVRVQALSESGIACIPSRFIKPPALRPSIESRPGNKRQQISIPTINLADLVADGSALKYPAATVEAIAEACREWGFFQVVNHGVSRDLMQRVREVWKQFFSLPTEEKQAYANSPRTYEGYGSRTGVEKGAVLDWGDYFYLYLFPESIRSHDDKWPVLPSSLRETVEGYGKELLMLSETLMKVLSMSLGLDVDYLHQAFGGRGGAEASLRANYYPKCPQPELTLGLSPHSDPGGITILLADIHVEGLQVLKDDAWVTVQPVPGSFIVNLGDQLQVMSNGVYKSVEHRVLANAARERISLAFFYNPKGDVPIGPASELAATPEQPPLYRPMSFDEYRRYVRTKGPSGKSQLDSLQKNITAT